MDLVFSASNAIHFAKYEPSSLPTRENRRSYEEKYGSHIINEYIQRFDTADKVTSQCVSSTNTVPTITVKGTNGTSSITAVLKESVEPSWAEVSEYRYYFEFVVDYSDYAGVFQIVAQKGSTIWKSEYQMADSMLTEVLDGNALKLTYTNSDHPANFPNFQINFTTGIILFFYVEAVLRKSKPSVEEDEYMNQSRKQLTEFQYFRGNVLETDPIPKFLAEKIQLAAGHFTFMVNGLGYKAKEANIEESGNTNFDVLKMDLIEQDTLGLSTDDRGATIIINDDMEAQSIEITSTGTITLKAGWMLHTITAKHAVDSAADVYQFKVGSTPGGNDIILEMTTNIVKTDKPRGVPLHQVEDFSVDKTIYFEIVDSPGAKAVFYITNLYIVP
jgi:hypothetical protein